MLDDGALSDLPTPPAEPPAFRPPQWLSDEADRMTMALHTEGMSATAIGAVMGVSKNAVIGLIRRIKDSNGTYRPQASPMRTKGLRTDGTPMPPKVERLPKPPTTTIRGSCNPAVLAYVPAHRGKCLWPMWGDHERPTMRFCDGPTTGPGQSYCAHHRAIAWQPREDRR